MTTAVQVGLWAALGAALGIVVVLWPVIRWLEQAKTRQREEIAQLFAQQEKALAQLAESVTAIGDRLHRLDLALGQHFHPNGLAPFGVPWATYAGLVKALHHSLVVKKDKTQEDIETQAKLEAWLRKGVPGEVPPADGL